MEKAYSRIVWVNYPSIDTPVNEANLNKMDNAINISDDRIVSMNMTKADKDSIKTLVESITYNESNGVLTITKQNGTSANIDTKLEKLAVNFTYNPTTQKLIITLDDKTTQEVDLSSLISQYEFLNSDTVAFTLVEGKVKANVVNGSITANHLQPNYLADITVQAQTATAQANKSKRYAVGGVETGDTTDNAKYYKEQAELFKNQAKTFRDEAEDISGVGVAAIDKLGLVNGNGNVEVRTTGDMWADPYKDKATALKGTFITCPVADDGLLHVKEMSGETIQKATVEGKNKFPRFNNQTQRGISLTVSEDGTITLNGTNSDTVNAIFNVPIYIDMPIGTKYGLSANNQVANGQVHIRLSTNANGEVYDIFNVPLDVINKNVLYTTTIGGKPQYATIRVGANQTLTNFTIKPQLEFGPTTTYEPFTPNSPSSEYPSPLEYAKEFDVMTSTDNLTPRFVNQTLNGVIMTVATDGEITLNGTATNDCYMYGEAPNGKDFLYVQGQYTFSLNNPVTSSFTFIFARKDVSSQNLSLTATAINRVSTVTITEPFMANRCYIHIPKGTILNNVTMKPKLEKNSVATPYTEHKGDKKSISFPFMSVPSGIKNSKEYINGVFSDAIRVSDITFNGTESWTLRNDGNGVSTVSFNLPKSSHGKDVALNSVDLYCSNIPVTTGSSTDGKESIGTGSTGEFYIEINIVRLTGFSYSMSSAEKINLFKTWLTTNNVHVVFKLATPIIIPTDEIYLQTYKGTTNFFSNSYPQVSMTADFKSELWSRDYLQDENDVRLDNKLNEINGYFTKYTTSPLSVLSQVELDNAINNVSSVDRQWYRLAVHVNVENLTLHGGVWYIEGFRHSSGYEWQNASTYYVGGSAKRTRAKMDNVWSSWSNMLTSLDLIQSDTVSDASKPVSSVVTEALGKEIDTLNNNLVKYKYIAGMAVNSIANQHALVYDIASDVELAGKNVLGVIPSIVAGWANGEYIFSLYYNIETKKVMLTASITQTYTVSFTVLYV